jgi:hypothetical protein
MVASGPVQLRSWESALRSCNLSAEPGMRLTMHRHSLRPLEISIAHVSDVRKRMQPFTNEQSSSGSSAESLHPCLPIVCVADHVGTR